MPKCWKMIIFKDNAESRGRPKRKTSSQDEDSNRECSTIASSDTSTMELPPSTSHDSSYTDGHGAWDRQIEYILVCCGFVTSIGSYLEFPQLSAQHGGGKALYFILFIFFILN